MSIKFALIDPIKKLYLQFHNFDLNISVEDGQIVIFNEEKIVKQPVSIRFINQFKTIIKQVDKIIQTKKQNGILGQYVNKLIYGKIVSIGNNKSCIINVLNINLLIDNSTFFKGDTFIVDKQYRFLVHSNDDNLLLLRNHKEYVKKAVMSYFTEYDASKLINIYRKADYINYLIVDAEPSMLQHYVKRYIDNIEHINEDIGYEKVKFLSSRTPIEHIYLSTIGFSRSFINSHILGFSHAERVYYITDKLSLARDHKKFEASLNEIYDSDQVEVIVLNLHNDAEEISALISEKINVNKFNIHMFLKTMESMHDLTDTTMSNLIDNLQWEREEAERFMNFIINFYLYDYNEEINISKYIIDNNNSILNCLNKNI